MAITVSVPMNDVNMFSDIKPPKVLFGGNTEAIRTINPAITTIALNRIALPEWYIVCCIVIFLSPVDSA